MAHARFSGPEVVVYIASPLGFAESTRSFMYEKLIPAIESEGIKVLNPWDDSEVVRRKLASIKQQTELNARRAAWKEFVQLSGSINAKAIEGADGIIAVLDGPDVDSGTSSEIGYGAARGKWIVGYRGDFRRTGEDEAAEVNLQIEYFVYKNDGIIVHTIDELVGALRKKVTEGEGKWNKSRVSAPSSI